MSFFNLVFLCIKQFIYWKSDKVFRDLYYVHIISYILKLTGFTGSFHFEK